MSDDHKGFEELNKETAEAKQQVEVGGKYVHYKDDSKTYTVLGIAVIEDKDVVSVRYSQDGEANVEFIRPLEEFTSKVDHDAEIKQRFKKV
ncbi:MAG: DUF1653 domain-containing protein [bacterium]|nr:DUF1653 domain-containing protein [bacterium]